MASEPTLPQEPPPAVILKMHEPHNNLFDMLQGNPTVWCAMHVAAELQSRGSSRSRSNSSSTKRARTHHQTIAATASTYSLPPPPWNVTLVVENRKAEYQLALNLLRHVFKVVIPLEKAVDAEFSVLRRWSFEEPSTDFGRWVAYKGKTPVFAHELSAIVDGVSPDEFKIGLLGHLKRSLSLSAQTSSSSSSFLPSSLSMHPLSTSTSPPPYFAPTMTSTTARLADDIADDGVVLFLTRPERHRNNRKLIDATTGTFRGILDAFCRQRMDARSALLGIDIPLSRQYAVVSQATVLISVHGASLANMMWMPKGSAVVEVTLRYGYCCKRVPRRNLMPGGPCTAPCDTFYRFVPYPYQAQQFGIRYFYYDPDYVEQLDSRECAGDECPTDKRHTSHVAVDGNHLARSVQAILAIL